MRITVGPGSSYPSLDPFIGHWIQWVQLLGPEEQTQLPPLGLHVCVASSERVRPNLTAREPLQVSRLTEEQTYLCDLRFMACDLHPGTASALSKAVY